MEVEILPVGDMAIQLSYHMPVTEKLHKLIQQTSKLIIEKDLNGVLELVPGFQSITIYYDPLSVTYNELSRLISEVCTLAKVEADHSPKEVIYIPTCYGGAFGEDIEKVASTHGLHENDVINLHCSVDYLVYMIGFLPGFPYLKGLRDEISSPRLATPRLRVPKGAVGIGGNQTGIYPFESPGGWNLIGRTPIRLFDPIQPTPFLLKAGDIIRFTSISSDEFYEIEARINEQSYQVKREVIADETY